MTIVFRYFTEFG